MSREVIKRKKNHIKLPIKLLRTNCSYFVSSLQHEYSARQTYCDITSINNKEHQLLPTMAHHLPDLLFLVPVEEASIRSPSKASRVCWKYSRARGDNMPIYPA